MPAVFETKPPEVTQWRCSSDAQLRPLMKNQRGIKPLLSASLSSFEKPPVPPNPLSISTSSNSRLPGLQLHASPPAAPDVASLITTGDELTTTGCGRAETLLLIDRKSCATASRWRRKRHKRLCTRIIESIYGNVLLLILPRFQVNWEWTAAHKLPSDTTLASVHAPPDRVIIHSSGEGRLRAISLLHAERLISVTALAGSTLFISLPSLCFFFFPMCHSLFCLSSLKQASLFWSVSQPSRLLVVYSPPFSVLNKVVRSPFKPPGWAVPLSTWERIVD